ncbi:unnamed protein product [Peronospora belbahrii]|uniref:Uncharacterized protein n=1 Tax=Peronospora belbahrii TaxID=622444 RepID=A0ABN8CYL9_9STRA|nr:unnamed protein product [Peronospora belbahrii]
MIVGDSAAHAPTDEVDALYRLKAYLKPATGKLVTTPVDIDTRMCHFHSGIFAELTAEVLPSVIITGAH